MYQKDERTRRVCVACRNHWFCTLNMQIWGVLVAAADVTKSSRRNPMQIVALEPYIDKPHSPCIARVSNLLEIRYKFWQTNNTVLPYSDPKKKFGFLSNEALFCYERINEIDEKLSDDRLLQLWFNMAEKQIHHILEIGSLPLYFNFPEKLCIVNIEILKTELLIFSLLS